MGKIYFNYEDDIIRARLTSEYKFAVDLQSKMVDARRDGHADVARNAKSMGMDTETIIKLTGLSRKEVENLRV